LLRPDKGGIAVEFLVVGMMKDPQHARQVARALEEAGFDREDLTGGEGFMAELCRRGVPDPEAHAYAEGVRRGGAVLAVAARGEIDANQAAVIMSRNGALDIQKCADEWKRGGWSGRFNAEPAIETETYTLVFGAYHAGAGRVYAGRYAGPERRRAGEPYRGINRRAA
jgi:hypothetical protein